MSGSLTKKLRRAVKKESDTMMSLFMDGINKMPLKKRIRIAVKIIRGKL